MNPFFSIIIPTFNRAKTIRRPIDSILAQSFTDWELIIVDDGSTDNTQEIVESYKDPRIRYVWQENQKESAARNYGITIAKGQWICFQDSDDEYLPNHLQVLYEAIQNNPEYKVIRTGLLIYEGGKLIKKSGLKASKYDQFPFECFQAFSFQKSLFSEYKFDERIYIAEDLHFLLKIGLVYKFKLVESWTGIYHYDPTSSGGVGPNYEKNLINRRLCFDDILSWNKSLVLPYLRMNRCLIEILMVWGHLKYNKTRLTASLKDLIRVVFRFPLSFGVLVIWFIKRKLKIDTIRISI